MIPTIRRKKPICLTGNILEKEYPELGEKSDFYSQIVTECSTED